MSLNKKWFTFSMQTTKQKIVLVLIISLSFIVGCAEDFESQVKNAEKPVAMSKVGGLERRDHDSAPAPGPVPTPVPTPTPGPRPTPTPIPTPPPTGGNNPAATKAPLNPATQPQFVNQLPIPLYLWPSTIGGFEKYVMRMTEFNQDLGIIDPATGQTMMTTVWGYNGTYPGPTIEAWSTSADNAAFPGLPTQVLWLNNLPAKHLLPVDTSLNCGPNAPGCLPMVRTVTHLHGGHSSSDSDGHPDAWFTNNFKTVGHTFKSYMNGVYTYQNDQESANLWYHDHAMSVTRLNVYAGLVGMYIMHDINEERLYADALIPDVNFDVPLVIQDKSFNFDGSLGYDRGVPVTVDPVTGIGNPSAVPEFYGDMILVNGKIWPVFDVEPRIYRFRVLNGSNSRFFKLQFKAGNQSIPFFIIGSDGGLLDQSIKHTITVMGPAERLDILVDFSDPALAGQRIILANSANSPYPFGAPVVAGITDRVMAFDINLPLDTAIRRTIMPTQLRTKKIPTLTPTPGTPERELLLSEGIDAFGRLLPQLGTSAGGPMLWADPVTETPILGSTEVWKIINNTPDTHPIHQHLVQFRILDRQKYDVAAYVPGVPSSLKLIGAPIKPRPEEAGWKDTVKADPGEIVRIIATYDLLGDYVWHCHILEHEDHEMMRPFTVIR